MEEKKENYEEHTEWSAFTSWMFIIAHMVFLFLLMFTLMSNIPDVKREWDFGTEPFTPAESIYSSNDPDNEPKEKMVHALPEAVPPEKDTSNNSTGGVK